MQTLIRCRVLRRLIRVSTVCLQPLKRQWTGSSDNKWNPIRLVPLGQNFKLHFRMKINRRLIENVRNLQSIYLLITSLINQSNRQGSNQPTDQLTKQSAKQNTQKSKQKQQHPTPSPSPKKERKRKTGKFSQLAS